VILLDFWAFWAPSCAAIRPLQRALVRDLDGTAFALIGVAQDAHHDALRPKIAAEGITWRSFRDAPERSNGPIAARWNVWRWPTYYVIDHEFRIRFKGHVLPEALIRELVAERGQGR
jgi:thiol-disulfide isomerase/thioredoxin